MPQGLNAAARNGRSPSLRQSSANETNLTVSGVTGIAKKGWEYLWVEYEDYGDDTANALGKKVKAVYVEQVYRCGDFANLGIGT